MSELPNSLTAYRWHVAEMTPHLADWVHQNDFDRMSMGWETFVVGRHPPDTPILLATAPNPIWKTYLAVLQQMIREGLAEVRHEDDGYWYRIPQTQ